MENSYSESPCFTEIRVILIDKYCILPTKNVGWAVQQNDPATLLAATNIVQIKWGFNNGQSKFGAHILQHYLLVETFPHFINNIVHNLNLANVLVNIYVTENNRLSSC